MTAATLQPAPVLPTANDRLKAAFDARLWGSVTAAVVVHTLVFAMWPTMGVEIRASHAPPIEALRLPQVDLPPPPEKLQVPPVPAPVADPLVDATIAPNTDLGAWTPDKLPPPPDASSGSAIEELPFTPYTVAPELTNVRDVQRALEREYPSILRDAGIGGTVVLHVFIDRRGIVQEARLYRSSGHRLLDDAALRVIDVFRFRPALNGDRKVPVWVAMPVTFRTK